MRKHFLLSIVFCLLFSIPAMAWDHVYLIGSATTAGWTLDNAIEMTNTDNGGGAIFEWSGELKQGELKLMTGTTDWEVAQYGPAHDSYSTLSENGKESFNDLVQRATYLAQPFKGENTTTYEDYKFGIKQAGYYTVRLNCNTNQITTFPKQIYPVGDGCEVGWEVQSTLALTETAFASEVYEGDLKLTAEGDPKELKILNQHAWSQYQYGPADNGEAISGMGIYSIAGRWESEGDNKYKVEASAAQGAAYRIVADVRNGYTNVLKIEKYITLSFKIDAQARAEWGDMPVVIRYWMGYKDADDANVYDHTFYRTLTPDIHGVYSTTIAAVAPIKFIIQTCNDNHAKGCGSGAHWTQEMTNGELGYTADQKFEMVYENGHVLHEVDAFTTTDYTVRSHKGYASLAWEQAFAVPKGVEAYVGVWNNGDIELHKVANGVVPAGEGVILYDTQLRNSYEVTATDEAPTAYRAMTNNLHGAPTADIPRNESQTTYVLGDIDGVIAFYEYRGDYIPQYKAYLVAPLQQAAPQKQVRIRFASEVMSDIPSAETAQDGIIYDVMGRVCSTRNIQDLPQGIYIRNRTRILVVK